MSAIAPGGRPARPDRQAGDDALHPDAGGFAGAGDGGAPPGRDGLQDESLARRAAHFRHSLNAAMGGRDEAGRDNPSTATGPDNDSERAAAGDRPGVSGLAGLFARASRQGGAGEGILRENRLPHGIHRDEASPSERERVLATSAAGPGSTLPLLTALQQAPEPAKDEAAGRAQAIVGAIEERVNQAIRAERGGAAGATDSISIDLAGLVEGLTALTIRLSATGLDVVLTGTLGPALAGEAAALADRLSRRFGNRGVRILAAADDGRPAPGEPQPATRREEGTA